jgi:hypothetical protein
MGLLDSVPDDSLARLRAAAQAELQVRTSALRLTGPTVLVIRPAPAYIDSAGRWRDWSDVVAIETAWPALQAVAESAGCVAALRYAPGLIIDAPGARTFVAPVPAGRTAVVLLAPRAAMRVLSVPVSPEALRTAVLAYLAAIAPRRARA